MKKILVNGGAGFVGSNLSNFLVNQGHDVYVIDNLKNGYKENLNPKIKFFEEDLTLYDLDKNFIVDVDCIFHLACTGLVESISNPILDLDTNAKTMLNSLNYAKNRGSSLIYTSSGSVHGKVTRDQLPLHEKSLINPSNFYGSSKLISEFYCKIFSEEFGVPTMIFRLWNVYGYPQTINYKIGWIPVVTAFLTLKHPTIFGDGKQTRDFTYVKDVIDGLIKGMDYIDNNDHFGQIINLCGGGETSIEDLYHKCSSIVSRTVSPKYEPASPGDVPYYLADNKKAYEVLGWQPRSIDNGLDDFYNELKKHNKV